MRKRDTISQRVDAEHGIGAIRGEEFNTGRRLGQPPRGSWCSAKNPNNRTSVGASVRLPHGLQTATLERRMARKCPHCGASHPPRTKRCPTTGLPMGGDARMVGRTIAGRYHLVRMLGDGGM